MKKKCGKEANDFSCCLRTYLKNGIIMFLLAFFAALSCSILPLQADEILYRAQEGFVNLGASETKQNRSERGRPFPVEKAAEAAETREAKLR